MGYTCPQNCHMSIQEVMMKIVAEKARYLARVQDSDAEEPNPAHRIVGTCLNLFWTCVAVGFQASTFLAL